MTAERTASEKLVAEGQHAQSQRYLRVPKKLAQARAWENLSKGRALDPSNIDGLHLLADQVMANNGDYKCAKTILEAALKLDPSHARSNFYYSQLLSGMGEFDLAFQYADKALAVTGDADTRTFVMTNAGRPRYWPDNTTGFSPSTWRRLQMRRWRTSIEASRSGPRECSTKHSTKRKPIRQLTPVVMQEASA